MALNIQSPLWIDTHELWSNVTGTTFATGTDDSDSYVNVAYENVIESLQDIIRKEFHIPVFDEHRGNQSIVVLHYILCTRVCLVYKYFGHLSFMSNIV